MRRKCANEAVPHKYLGNLDGLRKPSDCGDHVAKLQNPQSFGANDTITCAPDGERCIADCAVADLTGETSYTRVHIPISATRRLT
ncbi:hypothetical protein KC323_g46 [Hortaea werneckii]|nr:hypothetical protein KC323_g46 [Hortaea werneckii]